MKPFDHNNLKLRKNGKPFPSYQISKAPKDLSSNFSQSDEQRLKTSLQLQLSTRQLSLGCNTVINSNKNHQKLIDSTRNHKKPTYNNSFINMQQEQKVKLAVSTYQIAPSEPSKQEIKTPICHQCYPRFQQIFGNLVKQIKLISIDYKIMKQQIYIDIRTCINQMHEAINNIIVERKCFKGNYGFQEKFPVQTVSSNKPGLAELNTISSKICQTRKINRNSQPCRLRNSQKGSQKDPEQTYSLHKSFKSELKTSQKIEKLRNTINGLKKQLTLNHSISIPT